MLGGRKALDMLVRLAAWCCHLYRLPAERSGRRRAMARSWRRKRPGCAVYLVMLAFCEIIWKLCAHMKIWRVFWLLFMAASKKPERNIARFMKKRHRGALRGIKFARASLCCSVMVRGRRHQSPALHAFTRRAALAAREMAWQNRRRAFQPMSAWRRAAPAPSAEARRCMLSSGRRRQFIVGGFYRGMAMERKIDHKHAIYLALHFSSTLILRCISSLLIALLWCFSRSMYSSADPITSWLIIYVRTFSLLNQAFFCIFSHSFKRR